MDYTSIFENIEGKPAGVYNIPEGFPVEAVRGLQRFSTLEGHVNDVSFSASKMTMTLKGGHIYVAPDSRIYGALLFSAAYDYAQQTGKDFEVYDNHEWIGVTRNTDKELFLDTLNAEALSYKADDGKIKIGFFPLGPIRKIARDAIGKIQQGQTAWVKCQPGQTGSLRQFFYKQNKAGAFRYKVERVEVREGVYGEFALITAADGEQPEKRSVFGEIKEIIDAIPLWGSWVCPFEDFNFVESTFRHMAPRCVSRSERLIITRTPDGYCVTKAGPVSGQKGLRFAVLPLDWPEGEKAGDGDLAKDLI